MRLTRWIPFAMAVGFVSAALAVLTIEVSEAENEESTAPTDTCVELSDLDPAYSKLSVDDLEQALSTDSVLPPSIAERQLDGIDIGVAAYHPDKRDCMRKVMLVQQVAMNAQRTGHGGSMWYLGRTSAELAAMFETMGLKSAWSTVERRNALAYMDTTYVAHVGSPNDAEHYRRLYYGLLIGCEATYGELTRIGARRETSCIDVTAARKGSVAAPRPKKRKRPRTQPADPLVIPSSLPGLIDPWVE